MAAQERYRLHHSYVWLGTLRTIPYIFVVFIASGGGSLIAEVSGTPGAFFGYAVFALACLVVTILVAAVVLLARYLSYRYIWYEFDTTEFSYYSGILSKKRVHVPYQKVQSVNEKASLLQRLVGVYTVRIETAGGADNKAVLVSYLSRAATERMRNELFLHKQLMDAGWSAEAIDAHFAALARQQQEQSFAEAAAGAAPIPPWQLEASANGMPPQGAPLQGAPAQNTPLQGAPATPLSQEVLAQGAPSQGVPMQNISASATATYAVPPQGAPLQGVAYPADNILDQPAAFVSEVRGIFGGAAIDTGAISYEYGLTNKELIFAAASGKSSWSLAVIGFVSALASIIAFFFDARIINERQAELGAQVLMASLDSTPIIWGLLASFLGVLLLIWVVLIIGSCLSYGGFKARRRGDRIEVEHGLITHVVHGMSIERIQTVKVHQTFFQRILGYCSVSYGRVAAAAESGEQSSSSEETHLVVHPFLPLSRVDEVVSNLTPEYRDIPQPTRHVAPVARRRAITRRTIIQGWGFWTAVVVLLGWAGLQALVAWDNTMSAAEQQSFTEIGTLIVVGLLVVALVTAVVEAIGALLWYRYSAFGYNARNFTLVNGGFSLDTTTVPRNKIQMAYVKTNPLQRHAQVATIVARDAAGVSGSSERLIDVSVTDAEEWLAWVQPKGQRRV